MPQFSVTPNTLGPPQNRCFLCENYEGPFANTACELPGYGFVSLCCPQYNALGELVRPGCVGMMAAHAGMKYPHETVDQASRISELEVEVHELKASQRIEMSKEDLDALLEAASRPEAENGEYTVVEGV